ncbi:MAG: cyclic peptide export ABC transporter [Clostridium sp.]
MKDLLFHGMLWNKIIKVCPKSFIIAITCLDISVICLSGYYLFLKFINKQKEMNIFILGTIMFMSSLGYTSIMIIITKVMANVSLSNKLVIYFILAITVYVYGQKIVRSYLINITNDYVYKKRMDLIMKLLNCSYEKFERIDKASIYSSFNNDTETLSNVIRECVIVVTSIITLILSFIYLAIISWKVFAISILVIILAVVGQFFVNNYAEKIYEKSRDIQNTFFKFTNDLISGFKELYINDGRKNEFKNDMKKNCKEYKEKKIEGEIILSNNYIQGQLLIYLIVGAVMFIFPLIFNNISSTVINNFAFAFMFIVAPVSNIIDLMPRTLQIKVALERINKLISNLEESNVLIDSNKIENNLKTKSEKISIELRNVEYEYKDMINSNFKLGPLSCNFSSNEITFITGGNGSGKTTLIKVIMGLYPVVKGEVLVNGKEVNNREISQLFSTVFNDYYLFEKLYGIDTKEKSEIISKYLKILKLDNKVEIVDGKINTIKLSTGQRKRLALLIAYLDDRPIFLFDEWAADQDPEFRKFFYEDLLPELKEQGKCIIAVTHDDRYFNLADKCIKMELGKIVSEEQKYKILS